MGTESLLDDYLTKVKTKKARHNILGLVARVAVRTPVGSRVATVAVLAVGVVGLLAPLAVAKKAAYAGQVVSPVTGEAKSFAFKVRSARKAGRLVPKAVFDLRYTLPVLCPGGGAIDLHIRDDATIPVQGRSFTHTDSYTGHLPGDLLNWVISGRVPRRGSPAGSIRVSGAYHDDNGVPQPCEQVMNWTVKRIDPSLFPE